MIGPFSNSTTNLIWLLRCFILLLICSKFDLLNYLFVSWSFGVWERLIILLCRNSSFESFCACWNYSIGLYSKRILQWSVESSGWVDGDDALIPRFWHFWCLRNWSFERYLHLLLYWFLCRKIALTCLGHHTTQSN